MKKINILKENREFNRIIKSFRPTHSKYFNIYIEKKNNDIYKFGISIGKKLGNAVTRNKYKRRIKNILDKKDYQNNFNCIIIIKREILNKSFSEIENDLISVLSKLDIFKGE